MYRPPKDQISSMPELQFSSGGMPEAMAMMSENGIGTEFSAAYSSVSEQFKRTPRKPNR
ncbi:hypothetical protein [Paenibacillus cremeus]|nr:hypothetical protein [Paenibacillus cremeus]